MHEQGASPNLERILEDLNRRFLWDDPEARFSVVRSRRGRRSTFSIVSSDRGGDIAVKDGREEWDHTSAEDVADAMASAAAALETPGVSSWGAPTPLAWTDAPKLIVSRYIDGIDLVELLRDPDHPLWSDPDGTLEAWLRTAGMALAAYHGNADTATTGYEEAVRSLITTTRKLLILPRTAWDLIPDRAEGLHARSYVDPNPSNWRRDGDGTVWLLDPPIVTRYDFVHRDVAQFLTRTERVLRVHGQGERYLRMREAFLDGYGSYGPALLGRRDRALLEIYQARFYLGAARIASRLDWARTRRELTMVWRMRRRALHTG